MPNFSLISERMVVMAASKIFFVQFTVSGLADTRRWTSESEILHEKLKMYIYFFYNLCFATFIFMWTANNCCVHCKNSFILALNLVILTLLEQSNQNLRSLHVTQKQQLLIDICCRPAPNLSSISAVHRSTAAAVSWCDRWMDGQCLMTFSAYGTMQTA